MTRNRMILCAHCFAVGVLFALCGCQKNDSTTPESLPAEMANPGDAATSVASTAKLPFDEPIVREERPRKASDWFEDVAPGLGVSFAYQDGSNAGFYQLIESVGGGVAALDFDQDGKIDLFFTGGGNLKGADSELSLQGHHGGLFRNQHASWTNSTNLSGLSTKSIYTHGVAVADVNADGFDDLIVAGFGGVQAWMNRGDGTFAQQAESLGVTSPHWNVVPAAADVNSDGLVDLYVVTYADWQPDPNRVCHNDQQLRDICGPTLFRGQRDQFFLNTGNGFVNATDEAQLVEENRGLGIVATDLDGNGAIDIAVVNDVQENQLYINSGQLPFQEDGVLAGVAYSNTGEREGSMGVDLGDFDRDGAVDLWYANYTHQDNSLLRNLDGTGFAHTADVVGLSGVSRPWVGFGTGFGDFNCDGWLDLYVINGHVAYDRLDSPYFQPPQLFESQSGKRFVDVTDQGGPYFDHHRSGRGSACVDFNNDGAMDIVVVHQNEPVAMLQNRNQCQHWLRLDLVGTAMERSAVGAKVTVTTSERSDSQWRISGGSYASHEDSRLLFTLPSDQEVTVTVEWLGGHSETFESVSPGSHVIVESRGIYGTAN